VKALGALRSITFNGGGREQMDVYVATFEHGKTEWYIGPLKPDGKIASLAFRTLP